MLLMRIRLQIKQHFIRQQMIAAVYGTDIYIMIKTARSSGTHGRIGSVFHKAWNSLSPSRSVPCIGNAVVMIAAEAFCPKQLLHGRSRSTLSWEAVHVPAGPSTTGPFYDHG